MIINPYNDEYMVYDYKVHRYVLTPKYVAEQMNIDLSLIKPMGAVAKENIPQEILRKISRTVYTQIYAVSNQNKRQEWELAKYSSARPIIMQAISHKPMERPRTDYYRHQYRDRNIQIRRRIEAPVARNRHTPYRRFQLADKRQTLCRSKG